MDMFAVMIGLGASLGIWRIYMTAPLEQRNEYVNDGLLVQFFVLIGSRLGYVFLRWAYYREVTGRIFQFYDGGLSLWGALVGGMLGFLVVILISERQVFQIADALVPMLAPLTIFGWLASWRVGVAYGESLPNSLWWGIPALDEMGLIRPRFPLQVAAALTTMLPLAWLETRQPFSAIVGMQASISLIFFSMVTALYIMRRADAGYFWGQFRPELWVCLILLGVGVICFSFISLREYQNE